MFSYLNLLCGFLDKILIQIPSLFPQGVKKCKVIIGLEVIVTVL